MLTLKYIRHPYNHPQHPMLRHPRKTRLKLIAVASTFLILASTGWSAVYTWANSGSSLWSDPTSWIGNAPTGTDPTAVFVFAGTLGGSQSLNNLPVPFTQANQLIFDAVPSVSTPTLNISGYPLMMTGDNPRITQKNAASIGISTNLIVSNQLTFEGDGGVITLTQQIGGAGKIVKKGSVTLVLQSGVNSRLVDNLTIEGGTVYANPYALATIPVGLTSATAALKANSPLRLGTLNGATGLLESSVLPEKVNGENYDIVVHALEDGTFGGTVRLGPPTGLGRDHGTFVVRGTATQTLTGAFVSPDSAIGANSLQINKDVSVGHGATLVLAGNASLAQQTTGAIVLNGGRFVLDNTALNLQNRLRDADPGSTGLDCNGGGVFSLRGNVAGTHEVIGRLQLGTANNPRMGALTVELQREASATAPTELTFQSLNRDGTVPTFATVDFRASDTSGKQLSLGSTTDGAKITFAYPPLLSNGLLRNTRSLDPASVGWATVNGSSFATYGSNGITSVSVSAAPDGATAGDSTVNAEIRGDFTISNSAGYALNSLRLEPSSDGQTLTISGGANLRTSAILLAGDKDFAIRGDGALPGVGTSDSDARYFHVEKATLSISARLGNTFHTLVKGGEGTLELNRLENENCNMTINSGVIRANPEKTLGFNNLQFRGGVLEITGANVFSRQLGTVNWVGIDADGDKSPQTAGSGGFSAKGNDVQIDLNENGPSDIQWESKWFVDSGHALIFGSKTADHRVIWTDHLGLGLYGNYNAREIRVEDNPSTNNDVAEIRGVVNGGGGDLLKTGPGVLELTAVNTYPGATLVREGELRINSPASIRSSSLVDVYGGATLAGDGTAGPVNIRRGGYLAPGNPETSSGTLRTADLRINQEGSVQFLISGVGLAYYERIEVAGSITLDNATLQVDLLNGFVPANGDLFFLLINDGSDLVSGRFEQGSFLSVAGRPFQISYSGDFEKGNFTGGNDVVLKAVPEPSCLWTTFAMATLLTNRRRNAARPQRTSGKA